MFILFLNFIIHAQPTNFDVNEGTYSGTFACTSKKPTSLYADRLACPGKWGLWDKCSKRIVPIVSNPYYFLLHALGSEYKDFVECQSSLKDECEQHKACVW